MKKVYRKPRVESEERLEQTSLACTATAGEGIENFTGPGECAINVAKGGAFIEDDVYCNVPLPFPEGIQLLS